MLSISYEFYKDTFGGSLDESTFNRLLIKGELDINYYTDNRLLDKSDADVSSDLLNSYRYCLCNIIDLEETYEGTSDKVIKSQSAGKVSESYLESSLPVNKGISLIKLVELYLGSYNLCCRWV